MHFVLTEVLKQQDISQIISRKALGANRSLTGAPRKSLRGNRQLVAEDIGRGVKLEARHPSVHGGGDGTP